MTAQLRLLVITIALGLSGCTEAVVGTGAVVYYYNSVPEGPEPPESVLVAPEYETVEVRPVTPPPVPDLSIANAWRGQPLHYEPVPQPPPPPPDPNAPYKGPRWYRLMVEDIRNFMN